MTISSGCAPFGKHIEDIGGAGMRDTTDWDMFFFFFLIFTTNQRSAGMPSLKEDHVIFERGEWKGHSTGVIWVSWFQNGIVHYELANREEGQTGQIFVIYSTRVFSPGFAVPYVHTGISNSCCRCS